MSKYVTTMTIYDVDHYTDEERQMIVDSYAPHERDARAKGIPTLGSGAIFPIAEDEIKVEPFAIPAHWKRIAGIDFGWDHPAAVVWLAYDPDNDVIYITHVFKRRQALISVVASAIKAQGTFIPVAWPHDGYQVKDAKHGQQLAKQYKDEDVNMLNKHAQFKKDKRDESKGSVTSVEAGLQEMLTRMQTGRWKVFSNCEGWLEEYRMYHREDGVIKKIYDDAIDASRYAMMMLRYAVPVPKQTMDNFFENNSWQPFDRGMGY